MVVVAQRSKNPFDFSVCEPKCLLLESEVSGRPYSADGEFLFHVLSNHDTHPGVSRPPHNSDITRTKKTHQGNRVAPSARRPALAAL